MAPTTVFVVDAHELERSISFVPEKQKSWALVTGNSIQYRYGENMLDTAECLGSTTGEWLIGSRNTGLVGADQGERLATHQEYFTEWVIAPTQTHCTTDIWVKFYIVRSMKIVN